MVASNARAILNAENELLDELAQKTSAFASKAAGAEVVNSWLREFRGRRESNDALLGKDDAALDKDLKEEIKILEGLRNAVAGDGDIAQYWRADLGEDIALTKALL